MTSEAEQLYVHNAGLVLLSPYLPHLFDRLGVLRADADGRQHIAAPEAAARAVHLLQYCIDGRLDAPEAEVALNKLLSGVPVATPVVPSITASPEDLALCDQLLHAVIANWTIIRNTSPAGLRETFLQREGLLALEADGARLAVQRKSVDVLVDQVPWSFALVHHRWMAGPIHVTW